MGKPEYTGGGGGGESISRMQCKSYDINLDEGINAQENEQENKKREVWRGGGGEIHTHTHIHSHKTVHAYTGTNAVLC